MNRVVLAGRLLNRPKESYTPCGVAVCEFSLLVPREHEGAAGEQNDPIECVAFRELAQYLSTFGERGGRLNLEGRLRRGPDKPSNGRPPKALLVYADRAYFVDPVLPAPASPPAALPSPGPSSLAPPEPAPGIARFAAKGAA